MISVHNKGPNDVKLLELDLTSQLTTAGEVVTGVTLGTVSPTGLVTSGLAYTDTAVALVVSAGTDGITYGVRLDVTTSIRVFSVTLAVVVSSQIGYAYTIKNPDAVQTLVGEIQAGDSAVGTAVFTFPVSVDKATSDALSTGYVTWELVDNYGLVFASGNAFDYNVVRSATVVKVEAHGVVCVPTDVPVTLEGQSYQVRWTLVAGGQNFYSNENLRVTARNTVPQGPEDAVEMWGDMAALSLVLPQAYDNVGLEIYQQSGSALCLAYTKAVDVQRVPDGYYYTVNVDTSSLPVSLSSYVVVWKYSSSQRPQAVNRQTGRLFVVNANLLAATDDMRSMINRSRATISNEQDIFFTVPYLLAFMRRGRDDFNASYGILTNFTMTDATGGIRAFWLAFSELSALRSQYIAEGEKAFNFSGQAISLDVDRTGFYESAASAIQSRLDNEAKPFKQNLIKKGITTGDGNLDSIGLRPGAIGSVGITITPASNWGRFMGKIGSGLR